MIENEVNLFAVLSMRKIKTMAGCINVAAHNLRQKLSNESKEAIDPNLSYHNLYEGVRNSEEFKQKYAEMVENAHLKRKIQRNASRIIEFVISFSSDYCNNWQKDEKQKDNIDNYFKDCNNFITHKYGDVILCSAIHFDETTPHIHIMCIPLIFSKEGKAVKLSSSEFIGGIRGLKKLNSEFQEKVGKKYKLAKGIEGR